MVRVKVRAIFCLSTNQRIGSVLYTLIAWFDKVIGSRVLLLQNCFHACFMMHETDVP